MLASPSLHSSYLDESSSSSSRHQRHSSRTANSTSSSTSSRRKLRSTMIATDINSGIEQSRSFLTGTNYQQHQQIFDESFTSIKPTSVQSDQEEDGDNTLLSHRHHLRRQSTQRQLVKNQPKSVTMRKRRVKRLTIEEDNQSHAAAVAANKKQSEQNIQQDFGNLKCRESCH
ncbi:unnamed protein product [Didymodactylos carnosus]|uniref:Uncharacterized protein n=1 Tax=Didymodactylos carnosus TaxID=1234261 RepID=A0A813XJ75_9BILA|nr:unnamed protein product [Didymodactylos carnosus]CAF0866032.1 unnamed protein product [Didymodactylos carnosus]CAF3611364.1 unnamed protein product [Didymodactylos carnosus]CAF3653520.1 unnamed protein product [Didymodactylos carnosus]